MQIIRLVLLATTALASVVFPRNDPIGTQLIISDIGGIDTAVKSLTTSINAYQGGVVEATPLFAGVLDIHLVNRKAYVDAMAPLTANSTESGEIVTFTNNTVGQSIPASVAALEAKKPQLVAAGLSSMIVPGLQLLKSDHDSYSAELLAKVSLDWLARGQAVVAEIDNAIQDGIDYFSS